MLSDVVSSLTVACGPSFVSHLLRRLIAVKRQATASTFHYHAGAETAEHTRLVILGRIQLGDDRIIWIRKLSLTRRTDSSSAIRVRKPKALRARQAKYVTARRNHSLVIQLRATLQRVTSQREVHRAGMTEGRAKA